MIHIVKQGEYLSRISKQYGFADWKTIWDDAQNADLKKKRQNPNVLYPGDKLFIPEKEEKKEPGATEQRHRFRFTGKPLILRLRVRDFGHEPLANTKCTLYIEGEGKELTTDNQGMIKLPIAANAENGFLIFQDPLVPFPLNIPIKIGHLDPIEEITGQKARLNNLGYDAKSLDGKDEEKFTIAVQEFQCDYNLKVDGICGPATQAKSKEVHG